MRLESLRYATVPEAAEYLAIMRTFTSDIAGPLSDQPAAEVAARPGPAALELNGVPVTASWDPVLSTAMGRLGVAVHEEAVLDELLACLTPLAS